MAPKRTRVDQKCSFWGPQKSSEGPRGPDLVQTATNWSVWVRLMVTTHLGLILGLFVAAFCGPSWPKSSYLKWQNSLHLRHIGHQNSKISQYKLFKNHCVSAFLICFAFVRETLQSTVSFVHPVLMTSVIKITVIWISTNWEPEAKESKWFVVKKGSVLVGSHLSSC